MPLMSASVLIGFLRVDRARAAVVERQADEALRLAAPSGSRRRPGRPAPCACARSSGTGTACVGTMRLGHDAVHRRDVDAHHVERADLGLLDGVLLGAERALVEHLDAYACRRCRFLSSSLMYFDGHHGRVVVACGRRPSGIRWPAQRSARRRPRRGEGAVSSFMSSSRVGLVAERSVRAGGFGQAARTGAQREHAARQRLVRQVDAFGPDRRDVKGVELRRRRRRTSPAFSPAPAASGRAAPAA